MFSKCSNIHVDCQRLSCHLHVFLLGHVSGTCSGCSGPRRIQQSIGRSSCPTYILGCERTRQRSGVGSTSCAWKAFCGHRKAWRYGSRLRIWIVLSCCRLVSCRPWFLWCRCSCIESSLPWGRPWQSSSSSWPCSCIVWRIWTWSGSSVSSIGPWRTYSKWARQSWRWWPWRGTL